MTVDVSPLISVALCVYNGERHLREQLDSVLAQTGVRLEVVALDDASADGSAALLRDYAARDARLRVVGNPENLGPRQSFEKAMGLCRGEFIAPCDQDDVWESGKLSRLLAAIGDADLAYCDSRYIDDAGTPTGECVSDHLDMMSGRQPLQFVFANSVSGHASLLRRDLFEFARPFPAGVFHDWWLALCAASRHGIVYLDEPLVRFRRHHGAFSPLGRDKNKTKSPSRNRIWFEEQRLILSAFSGSMLPGHEVAADFLDALDHALAGGNRWPLLRQVWRARRAALPGRGAPWINAIRLQTRYLRKLRRARNEPAPRTPRFKL